MSLPRVVSREEWLAARKELLADEKAMTRARDELNAERGACCRWSRIDKDYVFDGPEGDVSLLDLFDGRRQLIVRHFMFEPTWDDRLPELHRRRRRALGRPAAAPARARDDARRRRAGAAREDRAVQGRAGLDVPVLLVPRQRLQLRLPRDARRVGRAGRIQLPHEGRARGGRHDSGTSRASSRSSSPARAASCATATQVFHTYSVYARGAEATGGSYYFLDQTALGPPGGVGGAEGPRGRSARRDPGLRDLSREGLRNGAGVPFLLGWRPMAAATAKLGDRRDAKRNRVQVVAAARELFASAGAEVPSRAIAHRAGVGVGTIYRHFPTRADLVDAVLEEAFDELIEVAEAALAEPDSWTGFARFLDEALVLHARNRALKDVLESEDRGRERARAMRRRIRPLTGQLIAARPGRRNAPAGLRTAGPRPALLGKRPRHRAGGGRRAGALAPPARVHAGRPANARPPSARASAAHRGPAAAGRSRDVAGGAHDRRGPPPALQRHVHAARGRRRRVRPPAVAGRACAPHDPARPAHDDGRRRVDPDRVPPERIGRDADRRAAGRHVRQEADDGRSCSCSSPPARRSPRSRRRSAS